MALAAIHSGPAAGGPPLVMLHGFGGGAFVWLPVMAALEGAVPMIAYDLPGHEESLFARGVGGAGRMARAVEADLDKRGVEAVHLVGHSMGGAVAALVALSRPERVKSVTLLAPGGFGPAINHRVLSRFAFAATEKELREAVEAMSGFNARITDDCIAALVLARARPGAKLALIDIFEAMFTDPHAEEKQQKTLPLAALGELPVPFRVVWGEEDCVLPVTQGENLPANMTVERLEKAGHMLIDEDCPAVIAAIRASLQACR